MTAANVTDISANAPTPKPKKKASASAVARQAEAEDGFVVIEQRGVTLRIPVGRQGSLGGGRRVPQRRQLRRHQGHDWRRAVGQPCRRRIDDGRPRRDRRQTAGRFGKLAGLLRLLDEYGDEIEADLLREYNGVDLLDFYRGTLSARRLGVLVRQLSVNSSLVRALNDGQAPLSRTDHFLADLWALWAKKDHPVRAEIQTKARNEAKAARVIELRATYEKRKRQYGIGVT